MTTDPRTGHTVKRFDGEMSRINQLVLEMGGLVLDQIKRALHALREESLADALDVMERDKQVNALDVRIDEEILKLLAKRQPVASDLRDIIIVAKTAADLERAGDEIRKIGRLVERIYENGSPRPNQSMLRDINWMAEYAASMLRESLEAFDEVNPEKALHVIDRDREIEQEFEASLRRLTTYIMQDSRNVGHAVEVVLGLRGLERIGGHAKNIAGYIIYLVTGKDVRHEDLETIEAEVLPRAEPVSEPVSNSRRQKIR